jgi:hypothetical protein
MRNLQTVDFSLTADVLLREEPDEDEEEDDDEDGSDGYSE